MPSLEELTSQYPVLTCLAEWLSTMDLYHLALTSRQQYDHILGSKPVFDRLKRTALCDGRGLETRQAFSGNYWLYKGSPERDQPIEVRLWATKCDEAGALPCRKCGINICEECRGYTREPPDYLAERRPHIDPSQEPTFIVCMCKTCDAIQESKVKGQFLQDLCDCHEVTRWICGSCESKESEEFIDYWRKFTVFEAGWDEFWEVSENVETKHLRDNPGIRAFFCPCGAIVPKETRPRCSLCKRRHRDDDEWWDEEDELNALPFEDPCYPVPCETDRGIAVGPYPKLAYDGPIWQVPEGTDKQDPDFK